MSEAGQIRSYQEFWPYYLREHRQPGTRALHLAGTVVASALLIGGIALGTIGLILAAVVAGYAPAWLAHFVIEKNRPATFRYPLWSLMSDFRMALIWLCGGLHRELERAGIHNR